MDGFGECFGTEGPVYYIYGKLFSDPEKNSAKQLLQEFCDSAFGQAGKTMLDFYNTLYHGIALYSDYLAIRCINTPILSYKDVYGKTQRYINQSMHLFTMIYTPELIKKLETKLNKAEGMVLIGIINTLGERGDKESVDDICKFVFTFEQVVDEEDEQKKKEKQRENETLSLAAISALGKIGGEKAMKTLAEARRRGTPKINRTAAAAILVATDNLNKK